MTKIYEKEQITTEKLVREVCDACGLSVDVDIERLIPIVIEVNAGEEMGGVDEYDLCNDCFVQRARTFVWAGSTAVLATGLFDEEIGGYFDQQNANWLSQIPADHAEKARANYIKTVKKSPAALVQLFQEIHGEPDAK